MGQSFIVAVDLQKLWDVYLFVFFFIVHVLQTI